MNLENKYEWIERYHAGDLTEMEKTELEQMMLQDETLAHEVQLYGDIHVQLTHHYQKEREEKALRATLQKVIYDSEKSEAKVLKFNPKIWLMAASIALLLGIFWVQSLPPRYEQFAQHKPMEMTVRGGEEQQLQQAQQLFNAGEFKKAETVLNTLSLSQPENAELKMYYAITLMENGHVEKSEKAFKELYAMPLYKDWATWNLALLALKEKDNKRCEAYLQEISKTSEHGEKATKLLKKLKGISKI